MTAREEPQTQSLELAREELAAVLAMVDEYDGCFERVAEWEALEQWERDAYPENEPHTDREDCEWWLKRADALLASPALARVIREAKAEALREAAASLDWVRPEVSPCAPDFENCCGSEPSCDAMQPSMRVVGADWLRTRADQTETKETP